jgi:membrane peptidoglycan carboxypeptidase
MANPFVRRFKAFLESTDATRRPVPKRSRRRPMATSTRPAVRSPETRQETVPPRDRYPNYRRPLYYRPLFWLVLLAGAMGATGISRGYRIWQATEASLPPVANLKTFERQGTITIKSADNAILQKIGPATRQKVTYDEIPDALVAAFIASEDRRFL